MTNTTVSPDEEYVFYAQRRTSSRRARLSDVPADNRTHPRPVPPELLEEIRRRAGEDDRPTMPLGGDDDRPTAASSAAVTLVPRSARQSRSPGSPFSGRWSPGRSTRRCE
jgi:hypothetical protein